MENKKFNEEELLKIKELQEKYSVIGIQLVQLKLAQKNAESYITVLKEREVLLESQIVETNDEEKILAKELDTKYGAGSLDLETGNFTPKIE